MRQSRLFGKTLKSTSKESVSKNHELLVRGGFVRQEMAGVYTYLPLGLRVLKKIEDIVRQEMNAIGGQEILMPVLHPKKRWEQSGRWDSVDVLYKLQGKNGGEFAVGPTHEEIVTPLAAQYVASYKDLPFALYQIQTKFRDEARAKSGVLRGREFGMKDLYSFHATQKDLERFYEKAIEAYKNIFKRLELPVKIIEASGGDFTKKFSHEFSVLTPSGEDIIIHCEQCGFAQNAEVTKHKEGGPCPECKRELKQDKAIEAGNIFDLGSRFSENFDLMYTDKDGKEKPVMMGCYGFGTTRIVGTIVEARHDDAGIMWPMSVAPFVAHVLQLGDDPDVAKRAKHLVSLLEKRGYDVLYDDRDASVGEKFHDSDLIGIPVRLAVGSKNPDQIEWKSREDETMLLMGEEEVLAKMEEVTGKV